jgi:hypothetical protein
MHPVTLLKLRSGDANMSRRARVGYIMAGIGQMGVR